MARGLCAVAAFDSKGQAGVDRLRRLGAVTINNYAADLQRS